MSLNGDRPRVDLSLVIPVYNEVDNVALLDAEIHQALGGLPYTYEVVYVNDGSRDGSVERLIELAAARPKQVVFVDLRRNFGQTAAMSAGIDHARGRVIIMMDADLQNDPADVGLLMEEINKGIDVVSGWRFKRKDTFLTRRLPSMLANNLISHVTGVNLHDYGCTLKAYRREVLDEVRLYGEMHRFIPVFAAAAGAQISEVVVNHRPRLHGKSKYGLWRTFKVILDLITVKFLLSYRTKPMYLFGGVGLGFIGAGIVSFLAAIAYLLFTETQIDRTPLLLMAVTLVSLGIQSILTGLTTELLVRTYYESQAKPIYVVRRVFYGAEERTASRSSVSLV